MRRGFIILLTLVLTACPQSQLNSNAASIDISPSTVWLEPGSSTSVKVIATTPGLESNVTVGGLPDGVSAPPLKLTASSSSQDLALSASSAAPESALKAVTVTAGSAKVTLQVGVRKPTPTDPNGPDIVLGRVEWGQSVVKTDLKLVANKPALMRVFVTASQSGLNAKVRATFTKGSTTLGTVDLTGPATIPTTEDASTLTGSYSTTLPAAWLGTGLQVSVQADANNTVVERNETNNSSTLKPTIMSANTLSIVAVPVNVAGKTGSTPDLSQGVWATWPVSSVTVRNRAAYTYTGTGCKTTAQPDWSCLLAELDDLRTLDGKANSNEYYYGFVAGVKSGTIGIGYVGWPVSAGTDDASLNLYTMRHELGHNFGLYHAPCGTTSGLDGGYPNTTAALTTYGYDLGTSSLISQATNKDVMGYCKPAWVSSYMYDKAQQFLAASPAIQSLSTNQPEAIMLVSGSVDGGQVTLNPVVRTFGVPTTNEGPFTAILTTAQGSSTVNFSPRQTAHGEAQHFSFTVPDTGDLQALEVQFAGSTLARRQAGLSVQSMADAQLEVQEIGQVLQVRWNAQAYPSASITHVTDDGERNTLALRLSGGTASLPLAGLGAGGSFEVSLSNGLGGVRETFKR